MNLKKNCHSWWISKMQSGREDTLEEGYAIKICFKLGINSTETYGMLQTAFGVSCMNRTSVFEWHKRFKEGRQAGRLWGIMRSVGGVRKSIHQSWFGQRVRVRGYYVEVLREFSERIRWKGPALLQIVSVAFVPGQCTSPQVHSCHRLFDQDGYQDSCSASL